MLRIKKLNSLILSFVLIFISVFYLPLTVNADIVKMGVITEPGTRETGISIRAAASSGSAKVTTLHDGAHVNVLGIESDSSGVAWYKISFPSSDGTKIGYIRHDYLKTFDYNTNPTFEEQLAQFPQEYHAALTALHQKYPNWIFRADHIGITFDKALALEDYENVRLIDGSLQSLRSMRRGCYDWSTNSWITYEGGWYGASRELIAYYMDPRNFLNENDIFMYMKQVYDSNTQTLQGVNDILKGTFIDTTVADTNDEFYGKTYAEVIIAAAQRSSVNPYILASTIIQEQGTNGATLGKGVTYNGVTVYNFMHWKATGKTDADIINNGAAYAFSNGWTTPSKSIIGGAIMYSSGYLYRGQDTYFYKNYDLIGTNPNFAYASHQYAQNAADSYSSAKKLAKMYVGKTDIALTFRIPVYKDNSLPNVVSPYPEKSNNLNNYYFNKIEVTGLTPSFSRFNYDYSLAINDNTSVYVEMPSGASLASQNTYNLKKGDNAVVLTVKAQTGFTNNYVINVSAAEACTLTVTTDKSTIPTPTPTVKKGDTNGDGKISLSDLSNVRLHLLGTIKLEGDRFTGADTNSDGKISLSDLSNIRLHLIGTITLG